MTPGSPIPKPTPMTRALGPTLKVDSSSVAVERVLLRRAAELDLVAIEDWYDRLLRCWRSDYS